MTEQEINEGNEIIAHWEGLYWFEFKGEIATIRSWNDKEGMTVYGNDFKDEYYTIPYHKTWGFLMPIIESIARTPIPNAQNIQDTHYLRTFGMLSPETGNPMVRFYCCPVFDSETLIEAAWLAVVDFIKQQKQADEK